MEKPKQRTISDHARDVRSAFIELKVAVENKKATVDPRTLSKLDFEISKMMQCIAEMEREEIGGQFTPSRSMFD